MILERFEDAGLAHASYAVGCERAAKVAVVDPGRDVDRYLAVHDAAASATAPAALLSGDFLCCGSLGRPDLLGGEAKRGLAARMFASVQRLRDLPDALTVHPAHGAGSMCGAGMSAQASSTLGRERATNPYLDRSLDERRFVERLLGTVPPFPAYYRRMKRVNSDGARK